MMIHYLMGKFFWLKIGQNENFIMQSGYEEQALWNKNFELCSKKLELMKRIYLFKKGFVIFLKGAPFSDFIETGL